MQEQDLLIILLIMLMVMLLIFDRSDEGYADRCIKERA